MEVETVLPLFDRRGQAHPFPLPIPPDEALRLPEENALVFVAGERPIWSKKARFYEDSRLLERSRMAPPECRPIEHEWDAWRQEVEPVRSPGTAPAAQAPDPDGEDGLDSVLADEVDDSTASELSALV